MTFYVYKFENSSQEILYVGRTNNLQRRITEHFSERGHLPIEYYEQVEHIHFIKLETEVDMIIKELYYINLYKPPFNTKDKTDSTLTLSFDTEDRWEKYNKLNFISKSKLEKKVSNLEKENRRLAHSLTKTMQDLDFYKQVVVPRTEEKLKKYRLMHSQTYGTNGGADGLSFNKVRELVLHKKNSLYEAVVEINGITNFHYILYAGDGGLNYLEKVNGKYSEAPYEDDMSMVNAFHWVFFDHLSFREVQVEAIA